LPHAARSAVALCEGESGHEETAVAVTTALKLAASERPERQAVGKLGAGWIAEEALAIGLFAALRGDSFANVLRIAVNHDGDSDSTGSVAGQLYGVANGVSDLPISWARRVDVLEPLLILAHDLTALTCKSDLRLATYPPS
jgi:ADP-ribosylglycohydrolase